MRTWVVMMVLGGCSGGGPEPTPGPPDPTGTTGETGDTGTPPPPPMGLLSRQGTGVIDATPSYTGSEALVFVGDEGYGQELCRISYDLTSTAPRPDCPGCGWAFDLVVSNVVVETDVDEACALSLATEFSLAPSVDDLDGLALSYGYHPDYFGHAQVLMFYDEDSSAWRGLTVAVYDDQKMTIAYDLVDGLHEY